MQNTKSNEKIERMFVSKKIHEEYPIKIYEIDPYFYERYKERIRFDKNVHNYILFRIGVYFY